MTPKKRVVKNEEPFLNTVARKLGYAAGALTNVAQGLTDNLSALPQAAATKVRSTARTVTDSMGRRQQSQKKKHRTTRKGKTRKTAVARKSKSAAKKSAGRVKAVTRKKK